jgi:hypothetical protein
MIGCLGLGVLPAPVEWWLGGWRFEAWHTPVHARTPHDSRGQLMAFTVVVPIVFSFALLYTAGVWARRLVRSGTAD